MDSDIVITPEAQFQSPSIIPFPQKPSGDLLEDDFHRAAMFAGQSHLHLCRAKRCATNRKARGVLELLIAGQMLVIKSIQRLRDGGERVAL